MSSAPFEPDRSTLHAWLDAIATLGFDAVCTTATTPAMGLLGAAGNALGEALSLPISDDPTPGGLATILERLGAATSASLNTIGPGYLAYVPGGGLPSAAMAEFVGALINRYTGLSAAAPALCRFEADVLHWLAAEFGLPRGAYGLLTSGGSMANLAAIVAARHHKLGDDGDLRRAVVYTSDQAHHSIAKALRTAGIPLANLRHVPTCQRYRMIPQALRDAIVDDRRRGWTPLMVVSAAGTTNTGAIDPLDDIANIAGEESLWHHCDGAYGGAFMLCDEGRARLFGLSRADSITFDPHKGMFLPYGIGCLLVRDGATLRAAFATDAPYLHDFDALDRTREPPNPTDHGPELSREARGLRLWLPLLLHGAGAFREALREKLALAERFHNALVALRDRGAPIDVVDAPQLSTTTWRLRARPHEDPRQHDLRNLAWLQRINARKRVHLSSTSLRDATNPAASPRFTLRACVLSFRTHVEHVDACLQDLTETLAEVTLP